VTTVGTAVELQAAVRDGKPHIEITEHLDLTGLGLIDTEILGNVSGAVKSIRVLSSHSPSLRTFESINAIV
jgi:hypothetical protein